MDNKDNIEFDKKFRIHTPASSKVRTDVKEMPDGQSNYGGFKSWEELFENIAPVNVLLSEQERAEAKQRLEERKAIEREGK